MKAFLDRTIEGDWPCMWTDATYKKVCQAGRIVSVAVVLAHAGRSGSRVVSAFIAIAFARSDATAAKQTHPRSQSSRSHDEADADLLAYMSFPSQHRASCSLTTPLSG